MSSPLNWLVFDPNDDGKKIFTINQWRYGFTSKYVSPQTASETLGGPPAFRRRHCGSIFRCLLATLKITRWQCINQVLKTKCISALEDYRDLNSRYTL